MMFDHSRLELGLNALASLESVGALPQVLVFALDPEVTVTMDRIGVHSWPLYTTLTKHLPSLALAGHEPVAGDVVFSDLMLVKLVTCLSTLELGYDVLWLDGDVVAFRHPLQALRDIQATDGRPYDLAIQTDPISAEVLAESETSLLYPKLVAGVFYARSSVLAVRLIQEALRRQVLHHYRRHDSSLGEDVTDVNYDDQTAVNEVSRYTTPRTRALVPAPT